MILRQPLRLFCLRLTAIGLWGVLLFALPEVKGSQDEETAGTATKSTTKGAPVTRRLFEQEPYDVIHLDSANDKEQLKVLPLDFPNRRVPQKLPHVLKVRFVDSPDQVYEVDTGQIAKIQLFEDLVLKDALRLTRQKDFDEAFYYFSHLQINHPATEGLEKAIVRYLYMNGKAWTDAEKYIDAMSIFAEAHRLNPDNETLVRELRNCVHEVILRHISHKDYISARRLLEQKKATGNSVWTPLIDHWETKLNAIAGEQLQKSKTEFERKEYREARNRIQEAMDVWPQVDGGRQLSEQLARQYPIVMVGVSHPFRSSRPATLANWASRRDDRLLRRRLVEFQGASAEGGDYYCPWGTMGQDDAGTTLTIELRGATGGSSGRSYLTSFEVSRRILSLADPADPDHRATWAGILDGVAVHDVRRLDIQLRSSYVRPEALLQVTVDPSVREQTEFTGGSYGIDMQSEQETVFVSQPEFALTQRPQVREIVEHHVKAMQNISQMKQGILDIVDRLEPIQVSQLQGVADIVVQRYEIPTIHVLVPNTERNPFLESDTFRRALVYGIHREVILNELILGGQDGNGCEVLSGPFPSGFSPDDPLGYANNHLVKPRPYRPFMALMLFRVAADQIMSRAKKLEQPVPELKPLVLAHPDTEVARIACRAIVEQLKMAQLQCTLKILPLGVARPDDEDYDLLYMEWFVTEPIVDAARMFGTQGFVSNVSPFLAHSVRQLDKVTNWREARQLLHKIHETIYNEAPIVPLWQISEHFAYHRRIQGFDDRTVSLYQNVENWQVAPR